MLRLVAKKTLTLVPVLIAVSFLTFLLVNLLPGDPALQVIGAQNVSQENLAKVRSDLGLDDPLLVRYVKWVGRAVTGDLGRSFRTNQPVVEAIRERLPVTLELGLLAIGIALLASVPLGVITAYRAGSRLDRAVTATSFGLLSVPGFMIALFLIFILSVRLNLLPATGWVRVSSDLWGNFKAALMPALTLAIAQLAIYTRLLRTDMISTLQMDFVTLARSKGLSTTRILLKHALRPSTFSLMTVVGLQVGNLLSGAVIVETIFALPGLGRLLVDSIYQRDLLIIQGVVLMVAGSYVIVNFLVDIFYSFLDPRIRLGVARVGA